MADPNHLEPRDKPGITTNVMPGVSGKLSGKRSLDDYVVKYLKANMDEPADMLELSTIETKALHAKQGDEEIVLMSSDKFTFMDKMFLIVKYLERT